MATSQYIKYDSVSNSISPLTLEAISDVDITSIQPGQALVWNGSEWVNKNVNTVAPGPGSEFFCVDVEVLDGPNEQTSFQTLATAPVTGSLDTDSTPITIWSGVTASGDVYAGNSGGVGKCLIQAYLDSSPLVRQSISGGSWQFSIFAAYNHNISGSSYIYANVARGVLQTNTCYVTGTGNTRTVNASAASFVSTGGSNQINASNADASSDPSLCSYIQLPGGVFPIIAFTSTSQVSIYVPSAYVNNGTVGSQVAFTMHYPLFQAQTTAITSSSVLLYNVTLSEPSFSTNASDTLSTFFFGASTAGSSGTGNIPSYYHGMPTEYTKFSSPLTSQVVREFTGQIETPAAKTYIIDLYAAIDYTVNAIALSTSAGSCTVEMLIGSTPITGFSSLTASGTITNTVFTANDLTNLVSAGNKVSLVVSGLVSSPTDLCFTISISES